MIILSMEKKQVSSKIIYKYRGQKWTWESLLFKNGFFLQTISFLRKRNGPHPKKKSGSDLCRALLSSGAEKYCYQRGVLLSGRYVPLGGACTVHPGRAPRRGPDASRKHRPVPPQAGRRTAHFFTSFPGAGRRRFLPQAFGRALFLWQPETVSFGPVQKEMGSGTSRPGTDFLADHFFFAKKKRSAPQRKKRLRPLQSTSVSGAVKHCDHWDVLLPGVTPCRWAAFGADMHPSAAPGISV